MTTSSLILVVDDEPTIREVVRKYLVLAGYRVVEAATGPDALRLIKDQSPALIVLDIMLPGLDGLAITRTLRDPAEAAALHVMDDIPIILLTARAEELDRLLGFEVGADDYVVKPFSPRELVERVKAVLRRHKGASVSSERPVTFGPLKVDPRSRAVYVSEVFVDLTAKEFDLLWFLANHPRQVFSRAQLLDRVWGYEYTGDDSTVTVHIRRLREKIEPDPGQPVYIQTVWGAGYRFEVAS